MSTIHPVSRERHARHAWNNNAVDFAWARNEQVVAVSLHEAPQLMMALPLGFMRQDNQVHFIALLGLRPGSNLFVGPEGQWLTPIVPAKLQHYPFRRIRDAAGREILGVDEAGLLPPDSSGGIRLFDDSGTLAAELATIIEQLVKGDTERLQTIRVATILEEHGLLEPWELRARDADRGEFRVEGLYRVSETKLNEAPESVLSALHKSRAVGLAYCQLLSMQHVQLLGRLAAAHEVAARQRAVGAFDDHGTISFANL